MKKQQNQISLFENEETQNVLKFFPTFDNATKKILSTWETLNTNKVLNNIFVGLVINMKDWFSTKGQLIWKGKDMSNKRFLFHLHVSRVGENDDLVFLPTPNAMDGKRGLNANTTSCENGRFVRTSKTTGTKFGASLGMAAATGFLPTPTARDYKGDRKLTNGRNITSKGQEVGMTLEQSARVMTDMIDATCKDTQLAPQFVMEMMGFPTDWTMQPFLKQ